MNRGLKILSLVEVKKKFTKKSKRNKMNKKKISLMTFDEAPILTKPADPIIIQENRNDILSNVGQTSNDKVQILSDVKLNSNWHVIPDSSVSSNTNRSTPGNYCDLENIDWDNAFIISDTPSAMEVPHPSADVSPLEQSPIFSSNEVAQVDHRSLQVSVSKTRSKKYYCLYCEKLVTNYGRHLVTIHQDKPEVIDILRIPKGHSERHKRIAELRGAAQFKHNVDSSLNTGSIIVKRRPSELKQRTVLHYKPCPNCKEMFSKLSLRAHYAKCKGTDVTTGRDVFIKSRRVQMYIHNKASSRLMHVLSRSKDDEITAAFAYDELAILYGNKLARKFNNERHSHMIRSRLREIGKFLLEFKNKNPEVSNLYDIFNPVHYDQIVDVINTVAGLDDSTGKYRAPSTAYGLGLHVKSVAVMLHAECIKKGNKNKKDLVEDLISLMREGFQTDINKIAGENQSEIKRHKKVHLPTAADIAALKQFLERNRQEAYTLLKATFTAVSWKKLADMTLLSLQLFNRRRAGELETILIDDYKTYEFVDEQDTVFQNLAKEQKNAARYYARFFIRGKRNKRPVPVIISREFIDYIDILLEHRSDYGVPDTNPYVFGIRGELHPKYLRACQLMRHYSQICGAPNPETLRGTELRKEIATACALYNLSDPMVEDMANHLGHHVDIHKKIYRQSTAREVPTVVEVLLKALGVNNVDDFHDENETSTNSTVNRTEEPLTDNDNLETISSPVETNITKSNSLENLRNSDGAITNKRVSWSTPERKVITEEFIEHIECGTLPSYAECRQIQEQNPCLSKRTPPQIKAYIAHQTKKNITPSIESRKAKKVSWTTPEKQVVHKHFQKFLSTATLPGLAYCQEVISSNTAVSGRNPTILKAYVNNVIQKMKRTKS